MNHSRTPTIGRLPCAELVAAALVVSALGISEPAAARPRAAELAQLETEALLVPAQRGSGISLAQATAMAQSRFPGRVVRAETVQMGDRVVHEIRILGNDGSVRTVRIDAQTGSFL
jgi:uncharacterized membrane protein YkoI